MPRSNLSPRFISARSNADLQKLLLAFQTRFAKQVVVINIYQEKDGSVTCWYYDDATGQIEEQLNGLKSK